MLPGGGAVSADPYSLNLATPLNPCYDRILNRVVSILDGLDITQQSGSRDNCEIIPKNYKPCKRPTGVQRALRRARRDSAVSPS